MKKLTTGAGLRDEMSRLDEQVMSKLCLLIACSSICGDHPCVSIYY